MWWSWLGVPEDWVSVPQSILTQHNKIKEAGHEAHTQRKYADFPAWSAMQILAGHFPTKL